MSNKLIIFILGMVIMSGCLGNRSSDSTTTVSIQYDSSTTTIHQPTSILTSSTSTSTILTSISTFKTQITDDNGTPIPNAVCFISINNELVGQMRYENGNYVLEAQRPNEGDYSISLRCPDFGIEATYSGKDLEK